MINKTRLKAYVKTMQSGIRTIDDIPEEYRVPVYIELVTEHKWNIEEVDERYIEQVRASL